jgi:hypothetical protein
MTGPEELSEIISAELERIAEASAEEVRVDLPAGGYVHRWEEEGLSHENANRINNAVRDELESRARELGIDVEEIAGI